MAGILTTSGFFGTISSGTDVGGNANAVSFLVKFADAVDTIAFDRDDRQFGYVIYKLARVFDKVAREYDSTIVFASRIVRGLMLDDVNVFVSENLATLSELSRARLEKIFGLAFRLRYELEWNPSLGFKDSRGNSLFSRRIVCVCRLNDRNFLEKYGGNSSISKRYKASMSTVARNSKRRKTARMLAKQRKLTSAADGIDDDVDRGVNSDDYDDNLDGEEDDRHALSNDNDVNSDANRYSVVSFSGYNDSTQKKGRNYDIACLDDDGIQLPRSDTLDAGTALRWMRYRSTAELSRTLENRVDEHETSETRNLVMVARCALDALSPPVETLRDDGICADKDIFTARADADLLETLTVVYAKFTYLQPLVTATANED